MPSSTSEAFGRRESFHYGVRDDGPLFEKVGPLVGGRALEAGEAPEPALRGFLKAAAATVCLGLTVGLGLGIYLGPPPPFLGGPATAPAPAASPAALPAVRAEPAVHLDAAPPSSASGTGRASVAPAALRAAPARAWTQEPRLVKAALAPSFGLPLAPPRMEPRAAETAAPAVPRPGAAESLSAASAPSLMRDGLPRILEQPSWQRAALPYTDTGRPLVAIVIDDVGLNAARTARTTGLPGPLTLAFLPYGHHAQAGADAARAAGHEVMVHMPMEPLGDADPGPNALFVGLPEAELRRRAEWALGRFGGYVGFNNHMGSRVTRDPEAMAAVMKLAAERQVLFLDSRTSGSSVAAAVATAHGVAAVERDLFVDSVRDPKTIAARLDALIGIARRQGTAIAIAHPYPETLDALEDWLPQLAARGVALAPVSAVAKRRLAQPVAVARR